MIKCSFKTFNPFTVMSLNFLCISVHEPQFLYSFFNMKRIIVAIAEYYITYMKKFEEYLRELGHAQTDRKTGCINKKLGHLLAHEPIELYLPFSKGNILL